MRRSIFAGLTLAALLSAAPLQAQGLPDDFVYLRDIDPGIRQDVRYAGFNNYVGRPLAGYGAAECIVKRDVGLALQKVQRELASQNLSLIMFDCYRPVRAVRDTVKWAANGIETPAERRYNPAFPKTELFKRGYVAQNSGHSTGAALDLSLVDLRAPRQRSFDPKRSYADCTAPEAQRPPEGSVDMGTGYDCADVKAHTAAVSITPAQRRWRNILLTAMARQGFVNYAKEWWHFSMPGVGRQYYDFPITPRRR